MGRPGWVDRKCTKIVLGADHNGHVGEGNIGDEEILGRYGAGTRNKKGLMILDFGKRMDLAIVNTYFKKKDKYRVTYKSGGKSTQVDCVMCRRRNLKEMCDCKIIVNDCMAKQHRMTLYKMTAMVKKKDRKSRAKGTMEETEGEKLSRNV